MIYYKATTLDGTDFHTRRVHFRVGEGLPAKPELDSYRCCSDQVFHASDIPSETLTGCYWPCRLFEVEGTPVAFSGHKFGFRTFHVVREIESWKALGPNGEAVVALIEQCKEITPEQAFSLMAARDAVAYAARNAAREAAWYAAEGAARLSAYGAAQNAAWHEVNKALRATGWHGTWGAAGDATWSAVSALVVRDLIPVEYFNTLYNPWKSVMDDLL